MATIKTLKAFIKKKKSEHIPDDVTITRSDTSLPSSFLNEFDRLDIIKEHTDNEISSTLTSTSTALSDTTTINEKNDELIREREMATSEILANIERSMEVDLCYVLDCTCSMEGHIAAAKDCILRVTEHIKDINPRIKIRVGFCGYRDHYDGASRLQIFDFTDSHKEFEVNLSGVIAFGGGDDPEDVLGGLDAAITKMTWRDCTRVLFHIGDCPPHGRRFTTMRDSYPDGDPNGLTAEGVLEKMKSEGILYFFGKITGNTKKMIEIFRSIIGGFPVFDLARGDPIKLINKLVRTTTLSITNSVSLTSTLGSGTKNVYSLRQKIDINPKVPNWSTLLVQKGVTLCYPIPRTRDELKDQRYFRKENLLSKDFSFKIAQQPFSFGVEKYAYFAIDTNGIWPRKMVMKEYFGNDLHNSHNPFEKYLDAIETSSIASFLSTTFNLAARKKKIRSVHFLDVKLVHATMNGKTCYYITEPELRGTKFTRFSTNCGVVVELRHTLEAFIHFTYWYTGGYLVVCDLQGIELTNQFLLTDPAIHCIDPLRFGGTNLGRRGIEMCFLENHKCNEICKKLGLT